METRRIALVSGAGRGIGAAIARELARAGVGVVVAARTLAECERLADELRQGGAAAWAVTAGRSAAANQNTSRAPSATNTTYAAMPATRLDSSLSGSAIGQAPGFSAADARILA